MKSYIYSIPERGSDIQGVGDCKKGLLIVLHRIDYEQNMDTLNGLLKAINHESNDCRFLFFDGAKMSVNNDVDRYNPESIILLGVDPSDAGLMANISHYFWYRTEKFQLLLSHTIAELNDDKAKKMNLWKNLQSRFLS